MPYIERVESNLKGGCTVNLGPKTVIYGPNGSGKSTIIQAIELATSGRASDMEGRDQVKQTASLARLFPEGEKYARCETSSGEEFSWEMGADAKSPQHKAPISVGWPLQELAAILGGDAASVQAWLEGQVFGEMTEEEALAKLPPAVRDNAKRLMKKKGKTDFLSLSKDAKGEARTLRLNATRMEKTVDALIEGIAVPLTDQARQELEQQPQDTKRYLTQKEYEAEENLIYELALSCENFSARINKEPGNQMDGKLDMLHKVQTALTLIEQYRTAVGEPTEYCWVCGSNESAADHEEQVKAAIEMLGDALTYQKRCLESEKRLAELRTQLKELVDTHKETLVGAPKDDPKSLLAKDDAIKKTWKNAEASRTEIAQMRAKADAFTSLSKSLSCVGKDLLKSAKSQFEGKVNNYLPKDDRFEIDLASSRVGLRRDGALHSALSGAEWNRVLMAMSCAVSGGSTLNVLVPPDRAWDRDTLEGMMKALADADDQIVVMSTVKPEPVEGWTLIELTRS